MKLDLEQIKAAPLSPEAMRRLGNWLVGNDTGISSMTMAGIALGADAMDHGWGTDAPHDPSDFGRCYRLVKAVPEIRAAFPVIGARVPAFAGILENWDDLAQIYETALLRSGPEKVLFHRIQKLRGDQE